MKYVRTKNGVIIDLEKFINNEKDTPYYTDFIFDEITKDGHLKWTAVGTDKNTIENQRGRRCQFGATLNSEIIKEADTIDELCDAFVVIHKELNGNHTVHRYSFFVKSEQNAENDVYGGIWTNKGLIYVAKMNEKGCLELL